MNKQEPASNEKEEDKKMKIRAKYLVGNSFLVTDFVLGKGSFGVTSIACSYSGKGDYESKKVYVVKEIKNAEIDEIRSQCLNEINSLLSVDHVNVNRPIKYFMSKDSKKLFIFLEHANRGTLETFMKRNNNLSEKSIQYIARQLINGIYYMHKKKIIHRDLKPANILLHDYSQSDLLADFINVKKGINDFSLNDNIIVKVGDLGLSLILRESNFNKEGVKLTGVGSPIYMAPELWRLVEVGEALYYTVDLWAIGVILYQMLYGNSSPFVGKSERILFASIKRGKYTLKKKAVSKEILTFINGLLQFDSAQRFTWNEILSHPFYQVDTENFLTEKIDIENECEVDSKCSNRDSLLWKINSQIKEAYSKKNSQVDSLSYSNLTQNYNNLLKEIDEVLTASCKIKEEENSLLLPEQSKISYYSECSKIVTQDTLNCFVLEGKFEHSNDFQQNNHSEEQKDSINS